jgi:monoamine oxidase
MKYMKRRDQTIIIIGAGAAGLMAAKQLATRYKVIVLEANDRIGGRIYTFQGGGFTRPIEAGAEFIHGKLPLTLKLLKKAGITYTESEGNFYRAGETGLHAQHELIEGWDQLLKQMKKERHDMTLYQFLQKHYAGEMYNKLRLHITNYAEGFDVADITKASMKALYTEWSGEEQGIYRIPGGYGQLIAYLLDECKKSNAEIITNSAVTQVHWKKNNVTVHTTDGQQYSGNKCIVTVPLDFLQKTSAAPINFDPLLNDHINAAGEIGYNTVIKVVVEFNESFWDAYAKNIGFIISDKNIPTWWTQLPDPVPLLTGWKGGPGAAVLSSKTEEEILQIALESLSAIFKTDTSELQQKVVAAKVFNWRNEVFAKGAYSYLYPSSKKAKKILNEPVEDTIYFAGEALYTGKTGGTVESALVNGREVAKKIKRAH